ncbi:MAG TPA: LacI family DNA-binding transcriptional regulator [Microbacteriaceae bacterium]|nr:LacI family DNA-binding transcriptional regulator [Microbacteriaceae bacterium]
MTASQSTRRSGREPSIADVARLAGVAQGTVSNVLNRPNKVSEKTRLRVERAIDSLGFVRNGTARGLASGTRTTIGFVIADVSNSFFLDMARGAEEVAQLAGNTLLLANSDMDLSKQGAYLNLFDEERVAGILLAPLPRSLHHAASVRPHGRPRVILNADSGSTQVCSVAVDNELGGYLATRHLIELGKRNLVFVGGPETLIPIRDRHRGAERAVIEAHGEVRLDFIPTHEVRVEDGRKVGHSIAARERADVPDGIVAGADLLALGMLQSIVSESDLRIPDDIAIIGYDNNRSAWDSIVPISTVSQPGEEMGRNAARLLLEEVHTAGTHIHQHIVLEPTVVARQSTIGPRKN